MNRTHYVFFGASLVLLLSIMGCSKKQTEPTTTLPEAGTEVGPKAKSSVLEITTPEQFVQALSQKKPTIVKFYATWCPPCRRFAPIFEATAEMFKDQAIFGAVNIDLEAMRPITKEFAEKGVPDLAFFGRDGQPIINHPGGYEEAEFRMVTTDFIQKSR